VEVAPFLLIGNHYHAGSVDTLRRYRVIHIISMGYRWLANPLRANPVRTRIECDVEDDDDEYILPLLTALTAAIRDNVEKEETTYLHCHRGRSRSVAVAVAYLIRYLGMTLPEALSRIKKKRPMAAPNPGFMRQLQAWQRLWCHPSNELRS
jgi:protein-tyrosine phosphatase